MKPTAFLWAWNGYPPQPDKLMTRERAARLLRAWRRRSRQPSNMTPLEFKRLERGVYQASIYGDTGTLIIERVP